MITPNMGLTAWTLPTDNYDHSELANNFVALDVHDHSDAKGVQISTEGLANGAVTEAKLGAFSIPSDKLVDASITREKMAFTEDRLGSIKAIWRPRSNVAIPGLLPTTGEPWVIAAGQTLNEGQHDFFGGGEVKVPDLTNCFLLGASVAEVGIPSGELPGQAPGIGQTGGSHVQDLSHKHIISGRDIYKPYAKYKTPYQEWLAIQRGDHDNDFGDLVLRDRSYKWPHSWKWWGLTASVYSDTQGSTAQDIRPKWVGVLYIVKVKNA